MDSLTGLVLFAVFAVCILMILLAGADVYRRLTERDQSVYGRRTIAQYLTTRIRQADSGGSLRVEEFGEGDALVVAEEISGVIYETRIYCSDGYIRELFAAADSGLTPQDGDRILQAESMELSEKDGMLEIRITAADGNIQVLSLYLRSGKEVLP